MEKTIKIEGMMCGHCSGRVKKCLEQIEGIESAAMIYAEEYRNELLNLNEKKVDTVSLETLINSGLLKEKDTSKYHFKNNDETLEKWRKI